MKWYAKLGLALGAALVLLGVGLIIYGVWFKYERNDYVDNISLKFAIAAEVGDLQATSEGVTTKIARLNYNTVMFYLTRDPAFTLRRPPKDARSVDLLLGGTEHILVYETRDPQITLVHSEVNGKDRWHRLTYRDLFKQLANTVSEKGFREPNTVVQPAN